MKRCPFCAEIEEGEDINMKCPNCGRKTAKANMLYASGLEDKIIGCIWCKAESVNNSEDKGKKDNKSKEQVFIEHGKFLEEAD